MFIAYGGAKLQSFSYRTHYSGLYLSRTSSPISDGYILNTRTTTHHTTLPTPLPIDRGTGRQRTTQLAIHPPSSQHVSATD